MMAISTDTGTIGSAAADAASAPPDLPLTDAACGALRRVNPGGFGLRLGAELAIQLGLVHLYRGGDLEPTADATGLAPIVEGFPTAETRRR
jgi:hypothetical protein